MVPETNTASQDSVPLLVQQIANTQQLGAFIRVHKATLARMIAGMLLFLAGGVFFLAGGLLATGITINVKVILVLFGVLFLGQAIYMASRIIQAANQRTYLFQEGIVIARGNQLQPFPWNQVSEIRQSITRRYQNSVYVGTVYTYTLRRSDGYQVRLDNLTKGIAELGPAITEGVTRALVPRALQALQSGQTLTFPPFSINQQGMSNGREYIPWSQVQAIEVKLGRVTVKKVGTTRAWGSAMIARIPNFLVFTIAAEELRRRFAG